MSEAIQLEFYENSIDDMFSNCKEMMKMFFAKFSDKLEEEGYKTHWVNEKSKIKKDDDILTPEEQQAIRVYTENKNGMYREFNSAVRTGENKYGKNLFKFHKLYFLLVSSVQKLKIVDKNNCYSTYRRYTREVKFNSDTDKIRFGSFASSSLTPDQKHYGNTSCLEVISCYGAAIEKYSAYPEEEEVLIPPYEMFQLIKGNDVEKLKDCETRYVLKSVGFKSKLDCILVKK